MIMRFNGDAYTQHTHIFMLCECICTASVQGKRFLSVMTMEKPSSASPCREEWLRTTFSRHSSIVIITIRFWAKYFIYDCSTMCYFYDFPSAYLLLYLTSSSIFFFKHLHACNLKLRLIHWWCSNRRYLTIGRICEWWTLVASFMRPSEVRHLFVDLLMNVGGCHFELIFSKMWPS